MIQKNVRAHIKHTGTLLGPKPVIKVSRSKRVASENDTQIRVFVHFIHKIERKESNSKIDIFGSAKSLTSL